MPRSGGLHAMDSGQAASVVPDFRQHRFPSPGSSRRRFQKHRLLHRLLFPAAGDAYEDA